MADRPVTAAERPDPPGYKYEVDRANARPRRSEFTAHRTGQGSYDLAGELDVSTAAVLDDILEREPAHELNLNAAGLVFLDSSGMRVLLRALVRGRSITIRSPRPTVARRLRSAGLDGLPSFRIED